MPPTSAASTCSRCSYSWHAGGDSAPREALIAWPVGCCTWFAQTPLALLLVSLPDTQGSLAALFGREIGRAILAGGGEAELERVPVQFVDPQVGLPFGRAL